MLHELCAACLLLTGYGGEIALGSPQWPLELDLLAPWLGCAVSSVCSWW